MQTTNNILLVRPFNFIFNAKTSESNAFQNEVNEPDALTKLKALEEFNAFAEELKQKGVSAFVFDDTEQPEKPDAVFPNNWVTFHPDGTVILYPMLAYNRRPERRTDIIDSLQKNFLINEVVDLSNYENENKFLEGTGSIVFDHENKIAYACLSPRTDKELFITVCERLNYRPVYFFAYDGSGTEIYHTNVMMSMGNRFAVICIESIKDKKERETVTGLLNQTGHEIIDITYDQMNNFAGNVLSVKKKDNSNLLALSQSAFDSFSDSQKQVLEKYCELVPLAVTTIETSGGGSVRCMIAEIFLQPLANK